MNEIKILAKKSKIIKLFEQLNSLIKADYEISEKLLSEKSSNILQNGGRSCWFFDYYNVLDLLYLEMIGMKRDKVYHMFKTTNYDSANKPCAWYVTDYSSKGDGSINGPKGFFGFIPDNIDSLVLFKANISAEKKCNLAFRMFKDLIKQKRQYDPI